MMPINFRASTDEDGVRTLVVLNPATGELAQMDEAAHPNFDAATQLCIASLEGENVNIEDVIALFDIPKTIVKKFARLGERVTVRDGKVLFDGDEQSGPIEEQILDFLEAGEDVEPIVNFYHRLKTNPLGNVREGLFSWIAGQRESGNFTITPEGKVIGYKSFQSRPAKLRADEADTVFTSSRPARNGDIVNGVEVPQGEFAEHLPGDLVEMPRSIVLDEPSSACGVGLHIGTYGYAKGFSGDTVMTVVFDPRDIVSLPDSNSSWKLRVCRYEILEAVDAPLDVPLYSIPSKVDLGFLDDVEEEIGDVDEEPEDDYGLAEGDDVDLALDSEQDQEELTVDDFPDGTQVKVISDVFDEPDATNGVDKVTRGSIGTVVDHNDYYVQVTINGVSDSDEWNFRTDEIEKLAGKFYGDLKVGDRVDSPGEKNEVVKPGGVVTEVTDRYVVVDYPDLKGVSYYEHDFKGKFPLVKKTDELAVGDRVTDDEGDDGTIVTGRNGGLEIEYDNSDFGNVGVNQTDTRPGGIISRVHGKGGATSQEAKGNGRNPAQDEKGKFSNGRPGSARNSSTGRFC